MKKIINLITLIVFVIVFLVFPNNYLVSFADELVFDSEAFERDIGVLKHGYILEESLDEHSSVEDYSSNGIVYEKLCSYGYPAITSDSSISIDISNIDFIYIEYNLLFFEGEELLSNQEDTYLAPYLFKNDNSITSLTLDADFLPNEIPVGIKVIHLYRLADDSLNDLENAIYLNDIDVSTLSKYHGLVSFSEKNKLESHLCQGFYNLGYVQGIVDATMDLVNNTDNGGSPSIPSIITGENDIYNVELGYADAYANQMDSNITSNNFSSYLKSSNNESSNLFNVKIFNYNNVQIATLTVEYGSTITLENIKTACGGTLLDERWLSVSGEVATKYDFSQPITTSLNLIPQGCDVTIYDIDLETVLGSFTIEYGSIVTLADVKTACGGTLPADEFNHFTNYEDVNGSTVTEIIGKFDFSQPLKVDCNLVKLQYEVAVCDNSSGNMLTTFRVDAGSILTKQSVYDALGKTNYTINSASFYGEDGFEFEKSEVRANVLVTVIESISDGMPDDDSDNKFESSDGETSVGKGTNTGLFGFGSELDIAKVFSLIFILILIFLIYFFISFINRSFK